MVAKKIESNVLRHGTAYREQYVGIGQPHGTYLRRYILTDSIVVAEKMSEVWMVFGQAAKDNRGLYPGV